MRGNRIFDCYSYCAYYFTIFCPDTRRDKAGTEAKKGGTQAG